MVINSHHIIDFSQLHRFNLEEIGKKAYQIGILKHLKIPIPDGFVILYSPDLSIDSIKGIHAAYKKLSGLFSETSVNMLTSSLSNKSLACLDVKGDANLIHKIKTAWTTKGEKSLAIIVQKNIQSKTKGKIITDNPLTYGANKALSNVVSKIKKYFYFPQEVEYALFKGKIYITGVKPFTKTPEIKIIPPIVKQRKLLIKGAPLNPGIITGSVRLLRNQDYYQVKNNEIAVVPQLSKLLYSKISKARAVIADSELANSYDKIIYRKSIKTPTIVGAKNATHVLQNGNIITINGSTGEIYSGGLM